MSAWQHLSGYLQYKQGGALNRWKQRRRLWFLLNDESCLLYFYTTQKDAHRSVQPLGSIAIDGAAISLSLSESNQFVILSSSDEHILTAENHESMMIWLLGLQTKRDAFANKDGISKTELEPKSPTIRSESVSAVFHDKRPHEIKTSDVFRRLSLQTWRDYRKQQDLNIRLTEPMECGSDSTLMKFQRVRQTSSSDESCSIPGDEVFGVDDHFNPKQKMLRRMKSDNMLTMSTGNLCAPPVNGLSPTIGNSLPSSGGPHLTASCGNLAEDRKESISTTPGSSDSALDRCFDVETNTRISELEQELISAKCELAELKNSESGFKSLLERRESVITEMDKKLTEVNDYKTDKKSVDRRMKEKIRVLQNQNCFLNEEVKRLAKLQQLEREKIYAQQNKMTDIYGEVEKWKQDYLYILQSSITVPTGDLMDGLEVKLYGGNTHRLRVQALLEEARIINPSLPTFERLARSNVHVDKYGFRHTHDTEGLLLHYICSQLQQHYHTHTSQYHIHLQHWRHTLQRGKSKLLDAKDVKQLCRRGIPAQYRADVWRHLVYHHVRDVMEEKGSHYFINLCNTAHESEFAGRYRKQISLDLLRTMPSNVRFNHIRSEGTRQLQTVLLAFCHHNTTVGYCQGMNFIAGMSLLFLGPEDAFWTLVAMTEKYFSTSYFDQYLTGAQADQEVLKEMVQDKLPTLAAHLRSVDIDLSTITLNWFLAVFFDAVPFETLVRIWDIFLLEGPKVLFRLAIAMLHINLEGILEKKDTISIMRHLKSCARITYDVEGLIRAAFEDLKPFPRRRDINSRQVFYANSLKEHIDKKLACRQTFEDQDQVLRDLDVSGSPVFECAVSTEGEVWVCYGSQNSAQVCVVNVGERLLYSTPIQLDTRIMCVTGLGDRILLIGTLAKRLYAYNLKTKEELWCLHVHDTILSMSCFEDSGDDNKLFASLADGTIAVIENITFNEPVESPYYIPIGRSPVTYLTVIQSRLWCACGNEVHIMHANTLDMIDRFTVSSSPFDTILSLTYQQGYGVWLSVRGSSILELWDPKQLTCKMLYDVKENRHPLFHKEDESTLNPHRITCLLPYDTSLWIGTGDGTVIVCDITAMFTDTSSSATESITPSPYSTPSTRGVIDARSFQTKVQQLYDEMTEIKDMNVQGKKSTERRKSGNKDEVEKVIEKKTTRRKKREQINGDMLVNGDSLNIDKKSNRRSSVEKENGIEISSVTDENDNNKLLSRKKSSRASKRLLKREDNHVVDDEPIRFTKMNGEVPGKNKPVDETIEKEKPKAEQHHKNGDSAFSIVDFTGITNIEQDETTTNGRRRDRHRRKSGDKPKPSTTDNVLPHTYGKYERSVLSQMLMKAHQQKCNGSSSEELPVKDAVESGNSLLPITETHNEAPSGIPAMLELDEKSLKNHGIALTPDIREYDATGIEVSNLMSTLSPISESRESLSSPAGSERTPSPVQGKTDDAARLSIPDININRLSPISARSSSPSVSVCSQPEGVYSFELSLQVKMKIADRPLKSFVTTRLGEEPVIISFAGHHGDDEAVLQWKREKNEKIWTNAPILEVCPETQYPMHPQYMRHISAVRSHSADDLLEESADPDSYVVVKLQKSASCDD